MNVQTSFRRLSLEYDLSKTYRTFKREDNVTIKYITKQDKEKIYEKRF